VNQATEQSDGLVWTIVRMLWNMLRDLWHLSFGHVYNMYQTVPFYSQPLWKQIFYCIVTVAVVAFAFLVAKDLRGMVQALFVEAFYFFREVGDKFPYLMMLGIIAVLGALVVTKADIGTGLTLTSAY
jgi:hypothetical protein